jgi:hypothetical protein
VGSDPTVSASEPFTCLCCGFVIRCMTCYEPMDCPPRPGSWKTQGTTRAAEKSEFERIDDVHRAQGLDELMSTMGSSFYDDYDVDEEMMEDEPSIASASSSIESEYFVDVAS